MSSDKLPVLHPEEIMHSPPSDSFVLIFESEVAEKIIAEMTARVSGEISDNKDMTFPKIEGRTVWSTQFEPQILRKNLNGKTVSCFGWRLADEGWRLFHIRFLKNRKVGEQVTFEFETHYNHTNPALIAMLF